MNAIAQAHIEQIKDNLAKLETMARMPPEKTTQLGPIVQGICSNIRDDLEFIASAAA